MKGFSAGVGMDMRESAKRPCESQSEDKSECGFTWGGGRVGVKLER